MNKEWRPKSVLWNYYDIGHLPSHKDFNGRSLLRWQKWLIFSNAKVSKLQIFSWYFAGVWSTKVSPVSSSSVAFNMEASILAARWRRAVELHDFLTLALYVVGKYSSLIFYICNFFALDKYIIDWCITYAKLCKYSQSFQSSHWGHTDNMPFAVFHWVLLVSW